MAQMDLRSRCFSLVPIGGGFKYVLFSPRMFGEENSNLTIYNFQMGWLKNYQLGKYETSRNF